MPPANFAFPLAVSSVALACTSSRMSVIALGKPWTSSSSAVAWSSPAITGAVALPVTCRLPSTLPRARSTFGTSRCRTARSTGSSRASSARVGSRVSCVTRPVTTKPPRNPSDVSRVTSRGGTVSVSSTTVIGRCGGRSASFCVPRERTVGPRRKLTLARAGSSSGMSSATSSPQSWPPTAADASRRGKRRRRHRACVRCRCGRAARGRGRAATRGPTRGAFARVTTTSVSRTVPPRSSPLTFHSPCDDVSARYAALSNGGRDGRAAPRVPHDALLLREPLGHAHLQVRGRRATSRTARAGHVELGARIEPGVGAEVVEVAGDVRDARDAPLDLAGQ